MPFQVIFSTTNVPAGEITYFSAGENQSVVCGSQVHLQATVIGDTTGHVFEWEGPITGTVLGVTVTDSSYAIPRSPDTAFGGWSGEELYYINTGPQAVFDDKTWRFWIDRGSPNQQYKDVIIFGTPTSDFFAPNVPEQLNRTPRANYGNGIACRKPINLEFLSCIISESQPGVTKIGLQWARPSCIPEPILYFVVQEKPTTESPWVDVTTIPYDPLLISYVYDNVNFGSTYRILSATEETNSAVAFYPSAPFYVHVGGDKKSGLLIDEFYGGTQSSKDVGRITNFSTQLLTLKSCDTVPIDDFYSGANSSSQSSKILSYTVTGATLGGVGG